MRSWTRIQGHIWEQEQLSPRAVRAVTHDMLLIATQITSTNVGRAKREVTIPDELSPDENKSARVFAEKKNRTYPSSLRFFRQRGLGAVVLGIQDAGEVLDEVVAVFEEVPELGIVEPDAAAEFRFL